MINWILQHYHRWVFRRESKKERGVALTGRLTHYCWDWDGMTMDETCPELDQTDKTCRWCGFDPEVR